MNSENTVLLVKELEKINNNKSKNSYSGAWVSLGVAITYLTYLFVQSINSNIGNRNIWIYAILFVIMILLLLQSFYWILSFRTDKKLTLIINAILDLEKNK